MPLLEKTTALILVVIPNFLHILDQLREQREFNWAIWISLSSSSTSSNFFEDLAG